jgi:hypothetical protein
MTGTATEVVNGQGKADEPLVAHLTITGASGGLVGLHGEATIVGQPNNGPIAYTIRYHFDP